MTKDEFTVLKEELSLKKDNLWAELNRIDYQFKEAVAEMYKDKYSKLIGKLIRIDSENQTNFLVLTKVEFDGIEPRLIGYLTRVQRVKDKCVSVSYTINGSINLSKWKDFDDIKIVSSIEYNSALKEYNNQISTYLKEHEVFKSIQ